MKTPVTIAPEALDFTRLIRSGETVYQASHFHDWRGRMSAQGVRRDKAALSSGCKPPGDSLQPEAIGAVMEVTKWLKPSISVSRIGDSASVQAATRVHAEQASHDEA